MKRKNLITVAIDSPSAAGAGTQAKLIAKYYNLIHLDTGRIYRFLGKISLDYPEKFNLVYFQNSNYRNKNQEKGIIWNDIDLNLKLPIKKPLISKKDKLNISLKQFLKKYKHL